MAAKWLNRNHRGRQDGTVPDAEDPSHGQNQTLDLASIVPRAPSALQRVASRFNIHGQNNMTPQLQLPEAEVSPSRSDRRRAKKNKRQQQADEVQQVHQSADVNSLPNPFINGHPNPLMCNPVNSAGPVIPQEFLDRPYISPEDHGMFKHHCFQILF